MHKAHTGEQAPDQYLLAQVREAFGRVVYSHKTDEKQADLCFRKHRHQQTALVVFTAISTTTFLASVLGLLARPLVSSLATSAIALMVSVLSLAARNFRFGEESRAHRDTAARLWDIRESYLSLIADIMAGAASTSDARARRNKLQDVARSAYADAPRTTAKAFHQASKGLKDNEEMTFTSQGIDLFLPEALRLDQKKA